NLGDPVLRLHYRHWSAGRVLLHCFRLIRPRLLVDPAAPGSKVPLLGLSLIMLRQSVDQGRRPGPLPAQSIRGSLQFRRVVLLLPATLATIPNRRSSAVQLGDLERPREGLVLVRLEQLACGEARPHPVTRLLDPREHAGHLSLAHGDWPVLPRELERSPRPG